MTLKEHLNISARSVKLIYSLNKKFFVSSILKSIGRMGISLISSASGGYSVRTLSVTSISISISAPRRIC